MLRPATARTRHDAVVRLQQRGVDGEVGGRARVRLRPRNKERRKRALVSKRASDACTCVAAPAASHRRPARGAPAARVWLRRVAPAACVRRHGAGAAARARVSRSRRACVRSRAARLHVHAPRRRIQAERRQRTIPADVLHLQRAASRPQRPRTTRTLARAHTHARKPFRTHTQPRRARWRPANSAPHAHAASRARAWSMTSLPP
jgi:hypothetical protein